MVALDKMRALLFVPANRPERFEKAAASGADAVIIDLEDAVPAAAKSKARAALRADFTNIPVLVRVNGQQTPWHAEDMATVSQLPFTGIVVPKAELACGLADLTVKSRAMILPLIETARGLADARQIAALPGVSRLLFGSVDFCTDLGCSHTREALRFARSEVVLASRLAGIAAPIDGVTTAIDDKDCIAEDARHACEIGFGGKLAIHPRQIEPIKAGFRPGQSEIEWAKRALESGDGAIAVDGMMVDEPVRIRASAILRRAADD